MTKEERYDNEIAPLMAKILEICKAAKIALIADFALDDSEESEGLHCTSALLAHDFGPSEAQIDAYELLKPKPSYAFAETHQTMEDGSKRISIRRIS